MNHAEWETRRAILVKILTAVRNGWPAPVPAETYNAEAPLNCSYRLSGNYRWSSPVSPLARFLSISPQFRRYA